MNNNYFRPGSGSGIVVGSALALAAWLWAPASATAATQTWNTPVYGGYDWVVPSGVTTATFELFGASGAGTGGVLAVSYQGDGGKTIGTIAVTPGETLKINVGGAPPGGINGGGSGGASSQDCSVVDLGNQQCLGAGGGGASDVRQGGTALANRVLVAGGGGGAGGHNNDYNGQSGWSPAYGGGGGAGGLLEAGGGGNGDGRRQGATDYPGGCGGGGGTQTAVTVPTGEPHPGPCHQGQGYVYQGGGGGSGYTSPGNGGSGLSNGTNSGSGGIGSGTGGGGGGGYVGGGGGSDGYSGGAGGGGGGGSSFAVAAATNVSMLGGVNSGDGKVIVTYGEGFDAELLSGKALTLTDNQDPKKRAVVFVSKDANIDIGAGNSSVDDPRTNGGTLRIRTSSGCQPNPSPCDNTYQLPASGWALIGKPGQNKGYKYKDVKLVNGPIAAASVTPGKLLRISGKGAGLSHELKADPSPLNIELSVGAKRFCLSFGGTTTFKVRKKSATFRAKNAPTATSCPP
ncbi:MAG TPA: hypothetical protein VFD92_21955 [Candidatus Binatia bacterium]|nr:hypothetical protein [Candidatus Binatia bacterium]